MLNPHEYLNSFENFESHLQNLKPGDFNLSRVEELLDMCGNPHQGLRIIHVAGTKGKGTTCAFLSHILAASGLRVGLYTSPHLHRVNERIRILDKDNIQSNIDFYGSITDEALGETLNTLRPHIAAIFNRGGFLTYFEILTATAILYFKQQNIDWAVIETGLGGRLDATNVLESLIAVITPISLDHTKILGDTLDKIAVEKAGIIKSSKQRVIIAPQESSAMEVVLKRCHEFGIPPIVVDKISDISIRLKGDHQRINATTALKVIELLQQWNYHTINQEHINQGFELTRWEGRFEIVSRNPHVIIDCAHNVASVKALLKTILDEYPMRRIIAIIGLSSDKDITSICQEFKTSADLIILTRADHPRAFAFDSQIAKELFAPKKYFLTDNLNDALTLARKEASLKDIIVVAGSMFVVGQIRGLLKDK